VNFYSPQLAVASFIAEFYRKGDNVTTSRLHIMDVLRQAKMAAGFQAASHTVVDPEWRAEQMSRPCDCEPANAQRILTAREAGLESLFRK